MLDLKKVLFSQQFQNANVPLRNHKHIFLLSSRIQRSKMNITLSLCCLFKFQNFTSKQLSSNAVITNRHKKIKILSSPNYLIIVALITQKKRFKKYYSKTKMPRNNYLVAGYTAACLIYFVQTVFWIERIPCMQTGHKANSCKIGAVERYIFLNLFGIFSLLW